MKTDLKAVDKKIKELIDNDPQLKELFYIAAAQRSAAQLIQLM